MVHKYSIYLKFTNGKIVPINAVTTKKGNSSNTLYPFCPAYATTMCKAQGQTLRKVVLWFDIDRYYSARNSICCIVESQKSKRHLFLNRLKPHFLSQSQGYLSYYNESIHFSVKRYSKSRYSKSRKYGCSKIISTGFRTFPASNS